MGVIRNVKRVKKLVDKGQKLMNQYSEYVEKNEDEEPSIIPKSLPSPSKTKNESTSSAKIRFCENCGQKIRNGASFCSGCGTRVVLGCNEVKRSASDNKQEDIEVPTEKPKKTRKETNTVESLEKRYGKAGTDEQKVRIVQSFVIPKEEEELLRLVAVCEEHIPNSELSAKQRESYDVETAWMKKLEQICERTRRTMPGSSISSTIESVYQDRLLVYQANNGKGRKLLCWIQKNSTGLMLLGLFVIALLLIILPVKSLSRKSDAEAKRFDSDVAKVQEKINEGDYQGALRRANALTTTNSEQKQKKQELINDCSLTSHFHSACKN